MNAPVPAPRQPEASGPPVDLRDRVLDASLGKRPPGRATPAAPPITPLEAITRASDSFAAVLEGLTTEEWRRPVLRGLDIQGLVGHLIGVERDVQRSLRHDAAVSDVDHVAFTQDAAEAHLGEPPEQTLDAWRREVAASLRAYAQVGVEEQVALHTLRLSAGSLMVVRTFELWAHESDIRLATGREPSVPDASVLTLMTDLAARGLPVGAARVGLGRPVALRLVLTGPGGGTWEVVLGPTGATPDQLGIVTDALGFCRLAANRLDPAELSLDPRGEVSRVGEVLASVAALALD